MADDLNRINLNDAPWLSSKPVRDVFEALEAPGHETRIVGGAVRNALLGVPVSDIDMATTLHPKEVMERAESHGIKAVPTGIEHGTITLISDQVTIEVTTLRADIDTDGRRAQVVFGSDWHGDAARRDFTINAFYCDRNGKIFDPLGGFDDLHSRRIRFIGDAQKRIREDYLRILRFIRFHGAYGHGLIDADGITACLRERGGLAQLSRERIWTEFSKILTLKNSATTIRLMFDHGLLTLILQGVPNLIRFENLIAIEDGLGLPRDAVRRLSALALFVKDDASRFGEIFRLSQKDAQRLRVVSGQYPEFNEKLKSNVAKKLIYNLGAPLFIDRLLLSISGQDRDKISQELQGLYDLALHWTPPSFPITGEDALALGMSPGPKLGRILKAQEAEWLSADFKPDREELLVRLKIMIADVQV